MEQAGGECLGGEPNSTNVEFRMGRGDLFQLGVYPTKGAPQLLEPHHLPSVCATHGTEQVRQACSEVASDLLIADAMK